MDECVLCLCVLIKAYHHVPPPFLDSLFCYLLLSPVSVFPPCCAPYLLLVLPHVFSSYFLFVPVIRSPGTHLLTFVPPFYCPKVISTGRPSMRIQCWRLRGAGSWNSSSLSSLSLKASSHLKVSATSEVRSQAPTRGVIPFFSIHVCDWVVRIPVWKSVRDCLSLYKLLLQNGSMLPATDLWFAKCPSIKA